MTTVTDTTDPTADTDLLHISAWDDPLVERLGHDPRSTYVEHYWLGILGPREVCT